MFRLDPRLEQDTVPLAHLSLDRLLLMCDARYPWLILVPAKPDLCELHDLDAADRTQLIEEIAQVSRVLKRLFRPDKINVGALGSRDRTVNHSTTWLPKTVDPRYDRSTRRSSPTPQRSG